MLPRFLAHHQRSVRKMLERFDLWCFCPYCIHICIYLIFGMQYLLLFGRPPLSSRSPYFNFVLYFGRFVSWGIYVCNSWQLTLWWKYSTQNKSDIDRFSAAVLPNTWRFPFYCLSNGNPFFVCVCVPKKAAQEKEAHVSKYRSRAVKKKMQA